MTDNTEPLLIGSGDIVAVGAGAKAANLDRASAAGMAVPAGFVVPDGCDELPDSTSLVTGAVAVRSAFSVEDGIATAMAGRFHTELGIAAEPEALRGAFERVRASGADVPDARLDVLVMSQVDAVVAGVAFTESQFEDDLVNATDGLADALVSGEVAGSNVALPKLRRFERPSSALPSWQRRLSVLLRKLRSVFGEAEWDIEWADDGEVCWLVQVRPITVAPRRNEAFTIANHKEILPELPSTFMASLIESASYDLMGFYRDIDPSLPVDRPFIESFLGRPYINLSQLTDLLRVLGLPTRLVSDSLGGEPDVDVGIRPLRIGRSAPTLVKLGWAQMMAARSAAQTQTRVADRVETGALTFTAAIEQLHATYVDLVNEMSSLATAMATPVAILRATNTLDYHLRLHRTAATEMLDDLAPLAELAASEPAVADALSADRTPCHPRFATGWESWLARHGHRGVFESDVARPRFHEDPSPIRATILNYRPGPATGQPPLRARLTAPLWWFARRPMAARERLRWSVMAGFDRIRQQLLHLGGTAVANGQLPTADALWLLTIDEVKSLDAGASFDTASVESRRTEWERLGTKRLPDLLRRFDDLEAGSTKGDDPSTFAGLPLTQGTVEGRAFRCSEPPPRLPAGFSPETTVLVARSVDAGWVPIFGQVAAVAVEIGGDLSHGSIILRELGLPAVTNLGDLRRLATGERVRLDAGSGRLIRLD